MNIQQVPYYQTGYFSNIMLDYLEEKETLKPFYNNSFSISGFKKQIEEKQFSDEHRKILVASLKQQYNGVEMCDEVQKNIEKLNQPNTYTITTGHQLNLFTGPLYYFYKLITTINTATELSAAYPDCNFVPVFWMATEDHDFEEINHFNLFGNKHEINTTQTGAVGRMNLAGVEQVFEQLNETLKGRTGLEHIIKQLKKHFQPNHTFASAIRGFINELFGKYGLVIIDGDNQQLKASFSSFMEDDLVNRKNNDLIEATSEKLKNLGYKKQVTSRKINLFYLTDKQRERIVFEDNRYKVLNTGLQFSQSEILIELKQHSERFSPNAVLRPLFQEVILPNLAYIGGGGELAYWLQLKNMFTDNKVAFPILMLRNSALLIDNNSSKKMDKLELSVFDLFKQETELIKSYLKKGATILLDLKAEEKSITAVFNDIVKKAGKIDVSLQSMVKAELQKSVKSLQNIENKLIKTEKQKEEVAVNQIKALKNKFFPEGSLQERKDNFLYAYLLLGDFFVDEMIQTLNPFEKEFTVVF